MILNQVFWTVVFMGLIVTTYTRAVTQFALLVGKTESSIEARSIAQSGIEIGLHNAYRKQFSNTPASLSWVDLHNGQVSIRYESERGKIDLNTAPAEMVIRSFALLSLGASTLQRLQQDIRVRRTKGNKIKSLGEFFADVNIDHDTYEMALALYTVFSEISYVDARKAHPVLARWLIAQNQPGWSGVASGGAFRIISVGRSEAGSEHTMAAIFEPRPLQRPPYRLASWQILNNQQLTEDAPQE